MTTTTAYVVDSKTSGFVKKTVDVKPVGASDVKVKFTCSGLCHTDLHMALNDWGVSAYPMVPGHEGIGVITEVGSDVKGKAVGQKVGVGWISGSCESCAGCIKGEENICELGYKGTYLGDNAMGGTFQQELVVSSRFVYPIPEDVPDAIAAPLLCAGITVYSPLRKWVQPGMNVGIVSVGGLGHLGIQFAKAMGANVTAFSTSPNKKDDAMKFGADDYAVFPRAGSTDTTDDFKAQMGKLDVILNTCPYEVPLDSFLSCLKADGVFCYIGLPESGLSELKVNLYALVFGQKTLAGSIVGGNKYITEMFKMVQTFGIKSSVTCVEFDTIQATIDALGKGDVKGTYRYCLCWERPEEFQSKADDYFKR